MKIIYWFTLLIKRFFRIDFIKGGYTDKKKRKHGDYKYHDENIPTMSVGASLKIYGKVKPPNNTV